MDLGNHAVPPGGMVTEAVYQLVFKHPGCNLEELAKAVRRPKSTVSGALAQLVRRGNIQRVPGGVIRKGYIYFIRR